MIHGYWLAGGRDDLSAAHKIRNIVFIQEQGFPIDQDELDEQALHAVVTIDGVAIGTGRLILEDVGVYRLGRICVVPELRGRKLGDLLIRMLMDKVIQLGGKTIVLDAQADKAGFYTRFGFKPSGEEFDEYGVRHIPLRVETDQIDWQRSCGKDHC